MTEEIQETPKQENKKRRGSTVITSVSVSEEFQKLIAQYNLSPTECFRRGIAVTLFDLGVGMYQSEKNEERSRYMHEYLKKISEDEKEKEMEKDVDRLKELTTNMKKIKSEIFDLSLKWTSGQK